MNKIGNPCLLPFLYYHPLKLWAEKKEGMKNHQIWSGSGIVMVAGINHANSSPHPYLSFVRKSCYVSQRSPHLALSVIHWINCIFSIIMQILKSSSKDIILSQFNLFNRVLNEERMRIDWIKLNYSIGPILKTRVYRAVFVLIIGSFGQD